MAQPPADRRRPASGPTRGIQAQQSRGAGPPPPGGAWELGALSPLGSRLDNLRQTPPQVRNTVTLNGRTYREIDNGKAGVLVPIQESGASQVARTQQRRAIERVQLMANSPLAGAAYGLASLAGASPQVRDRAMITGRIADGALSVASPRSTPVRRPMFGGKAVPTIPWDGSVRYRGVNAAGQALGVNMTLVEPMLHGGTKANPRLRPPGFISGDPPYNHARGHLRARGLGGSGDRASNLVTLTQTSTNSPWMRDVEKEVARRVRNGEIVDYAVTPLSTPGIAAPGAVLLSVSGDRGPSSGHFIQNSAGRPKK